MGWTLSPPRTAVSVWLILPNTRSYLSDISGRYHGSWEPCKGAGCPVRQEVGVGSPLLTRTRGQPGPRHPQGGSAAAERGIQPVRHTRRLAYSLLRHRACPYGGG